MSFLHLKKLAVATFECVPRLAQKPTQKPPRPAKAACASVLQGSFLSHRCNTLAYASSSANSDSPCFEVWRPHQAAADQIAVKVILIHCLQVYYEQPDQHMAVLRLCTCNCIGAQPSDLETWSKSTLSAYRL